jgi:small subunit ribosomal protein S6
MGFYETTYILHSALQEGRLNDIVSAIENKIKSLGAEILYSDNWGRKKLAYLINKEKYGTYIFLQFKLKDSNKLTELSSEFEHNPNILRYLNIKIDEECVVESKHDKKTADNIDEKKQKTSDDKSAGTAKKEKA